MWIYNGYLSGDFSESFVAELEPDTEIINRTDEATNDVIRQRLQTRVLNDEQIEFRPTYETRATEEGDRTQPTNREVTNPPPKRQL